MRRPLPALLLLGAVAALALRGPRDPLRPTTPNDGVGPLTRRRYWLELRGSPRDPREVARHWRGHLPEHAPRLLAHFRGLDHPVPPLERGDRLRILMLLCRRGRVVVEHVDDFGFRVRTLRLHPDAGTSDFRVFPHATEPGRMVLQVESLMRTNSAFDRAAYLLGVHALQRLTWERTLQSVAAWAGGEVIDRGHETLERPGVAHSHALDGAGEAGI